MQRIGRIALAFVRLGLFGALVSITSFHLFAWQLYLSSSSHNSLDVAVFFAVVILTAGVWAGAHRALRQGNRLWKTSVVTSLAVLQVAGLSVSSHLFAGAIVEPHAVAVTPGYLVVNKALYATTDLGTRIDCYQRRLTDGEFETFVVESRDEISKLAKRAMLRSDPYAQSNCHGWVFTGGQAVLRNEVVPLILQENGYQEVNQPQVNDVVVYRDAQGIIVHTGLVSGFLQNDTVLVESKWGVDGTYVHLVHEQPYSTEASFWRATRAGHGLRIYRATDDSPVIGISEIASVPTLWP